MANNLSKDVLSTVKRKTGKTLTESQIKQVAKGVGPSTVKDEKQLRLLIRQVSKMAGVPVSESTMRDLISAIKSSGINPANMEQMVKMMLKK